MATQPAAADTPPRSQTPEPTDRHPKGLLTLAGTEVWERLSFYGLQVILAYYVYYSVTRGGLGLSQTLGVGIVGAYGGAVYLMMPLGAWLTDRVFPMRYVIPVSGLIICLGHVTLGLFPSLPGLFLGLLFITLGTGGLFPNVQAMMGHLYADRPNKRDSGFALFYTGVMIGAGAGPLVTGVLQDTVNFHVAFGAAAVGMGIGIATYLFRLRTLPAMSNEVPNPIDFRGKVVVGIVCLGIVLVIAALITTSIITLTNIDVAVIGATGVIAIAYFIRIVKARAISSGERSRFVAFVPIFLVGCVFWTLILQLFTTFAVYADTRVNLTIGILTIPAAYISTFQVAAGVIAGPLISMTWRKMGTRQPTTVMKMVLGLAVLALSYAIFALISALYGEHVSLWAVIVGMAVCGVGEVSFAPVAVSLAAKLAPKAFYTQTLALAGIATAVGASVSGFVAQLYDPSDDAIFFGTISLGTFGVALVLYTLRKWIISREREH